MRDTPYPPSEPTLEPYKTKLDDRSLPADRGEIACVSIAKSSIRALARKPLRYDSGNMTSLLFCSGRDTGNLFTLGVSN